MNNISRLLVALTALMLSASLSVMAQSNTKVSWKVLTPTVSGAPGQTVELKVQAQIASGWHMYTARTYPDSIPGPQPTEVTVGEKKLISLAGKMRGPKAILKYDEGFELNIEYWQGSPTLTIPVKIAKKAANGKAEGWVNFYYMACDESHCLPASETKLTFALDVHPDSSKAENADSATASEPETVTSNDTPAVIDTMPIAKKTDTATAPPVVASKSDDGPTTQQSTVGTPTGSNEEIDAARQKGLGAYLGLAALMGLLALATPCVFPMIPITVSFFTKRRQTTRARTIRDAGLYSLGIILTFTALGFIFTALLGATGITSFAANPIVNIVIAGVFLVLALNLFGMFEIQLPTTVLNRLNQKAEGDGVLSVVIMGLVFSLTSFTCTVPFVGNLLVSASKGDWLWPLMGTAVFAAVFSAPFFLLALFPALMKSMPKSGGWLNSVKVVMGFIEVAAAIKFISSADLVWGWGVFNRELFLAIWIAVAVLITLYLLGHFSLPHDSPVEKVGALRVLFAISFLAVGFWLLTGLFGGRLGELEAQLPPPATEGGAQLVINAGGGGSPGGGGAKAEGEKMTWVLDNYEKAVAEAKATGKPIFIDFTGYACTNCRWMERNMFSREDIADLMKKYVLVRLYTDGRDEVNKKNQQMQLDRFKTVALPYYAIQSPEETIVATFGGMTREAGQFAEFLQKGLASGKVASR
jgi:thiol:disulfide interchange protein DsbD